MTNENPHRLSNDRVAIILEGVPCDAKEEDLVRAGYHSRDEIVDGLVEALSLYVVFCGNTAYLAPREGVQKAYTLAKEALGKAKP